MKWKKRGRAQVAQSGDYEAEIVKSRGMYWATCYELRGSVGLKKFVFPPKRTLKALKELVADNILFCEEKPARKQVKPHAVYEPVQLQWWQR